MKFLDDIICSNEDCGKAMPDFYWGPGPRIPSWITHIRIECPFCLNEFNVKLIHTVKFGHSIKKSSDSGD